MPGLMGSINFPLLVSRTRQADVGKWRPLYRNLGRRIGLIYGVENSLNHSRLHQVASVRGEEVVVVSDQNL